MGGLLHERQGRRLWEPCFTEWLSGCGGFMAKDTTFDLAATLASTYSPEYACLLRDLDAIAWQLKKFSEAALPVLWRPLHEADGKWFWWGAKGPEPLKALWRLMFTRFTGRHGLHNLIWVYAPANPTRTGRGPAPRHRPVGGRLQRRQTDLRRFSLGRAHFRCL